MKRGTKADLPSVKVLRGTSRKDRDGDKVEIIVPDSLPAEPGCLTEAGRGVWLDNIGRVAQTKLANELDSQMFANFCNLQGAIDDAWRAKGVPPAAHLSEARKMAEQFGLFGAKSRVISGGNLKRKNPFASL